MDEVLVTETNVDAQSKSSLRTTLSRFTSIVGTTMIVVLPMYCLVVWYLLASAWLGHVGYYASWSGVDYLGTMGIFFILMYLLKWLSEEYLRFD